MNRERRHWDSEEIPDSVGSMRGYILIIIFYGLRENTCQPWFLNRVDLNFCVHSTTLRDWKLEGGRGRGEGHIYKQTNKTSFRSAAIEMKTEVLRE